MDATASPMSNAATVDGSYTDDVSRGLQLLTQADMWDYLAAVDQEEPQQSVPAAMPATTGLLDSAHPTGLAGCEGVDAVSWGFPPLGVEGIFPAPRHPEMPSTLPSRSGIAKSGANAMAAPAMTPKAAVMSTTRRPCPDFDGLHPDSFGAEAACLQEQDWLPGCAAALSPASTSRSTLPPSSASTSSSASPAGLLKRSGTGAFVPSPPLPLTSSPPPNDRTSPNVLATSTSTNGNSVFNFDVFTMDPHLSPTERGDRPAAFSPTTEVHAGVFDDGQGQEHQGQQQETLWDGKFWRSASSCSAPSNTSGSTRPPSSNDEMPRLTTQDASKEAELAWPYSFSAHTNPHGQCKRCNGDGKNVAARICTLPGRSAVNKRCMLDSGDIDHKKLVRTREIALRSYRRRRSAELQRREQLNVRLTLLHKTKTSLLAQKANLMAEREYLMHLYKARMPVCF